MYDQTATGKRTQSQALVRQHFKAETATISTQVIQEFLNVAVKKFRTSLSNDILEQLIDELFDPMCRHAPDSLFYKRVLQLHTAHSLSFYDAMIIQAAIDTDCTTLYSEDLQQGQKFGLLEIINPFR